MTGNTKVWRAPLAGLASVAMIATMGVAASTANAVALDQPVFTVSFDLNGHGNGSAPQDIKVGDSSTPDYKLDSAWAPALSSQSDSDPTWKFAGWYTSPNLGEGERFNTQAPVLGDVTLYAHWAKQKDLKKVSYKGANFDFPDVNQDGTVNHNDSILYVAVGDKLSAWEKPGDGNETDGKLVEGFTADGKDVAFNETVSSDLSLAAKTEPSVQVKFDGGTTYGISGTTRAPGLFDYSKTVEVPVSGGVTAPVAASWTGGDYDLVSQWYYQDQGTSGWYLWDGTSVPTDQDGNLDSKFVAGKTFTLKPLDPTKEFKSSAENGYLSTADVSGATTVTPAKAQKVAFNLDNAGQYVVVDDAPAPVLVGENDSAELPTPDLYDGKLVFDGWYTDNHFTTKFYEDSARNAANTVYGRLSIGNVQYTVTFDPNYTGSKPTQVKYASDATVAKPEDPTRDGYVFAGWYRNGDSRVYKTDADFRGDGTTSNPGVRAESGLTLKALWITASQAELKDLLDEKGAAYDQNTQAWTDFKNKQTEVQGKTSYNLTDNNGVADYDDVNGLSHVSEAAAKDYIKQLSDLKGKLVTSSTNFSDVFDGNNGAVPATPHHTEIAFVAKKGISTGYADGTFKPTGSMFRQDYAAFLYRLAGSPEYTPAASDNIFTDVTPATPHYKEILWAAKQGIIKGFADGTFRGLALVNRQDAAAFLYRAAGSPEFDASKAAKTFTDVNESTPHYKEILWAANTVVNVDYDQDGTTDTNTAIINGFEGGTFGGYGTLLRQDGAAFLARTYFYINK